MFSTIGHYFPQAGALVDNIKDITKNFKTYAFTTTLAVSVKAVQSESMIIKVAGFGTQILLFGYVISKAKKALQSKLLQPMQLPSWDKFKSITAFIKDGQGEYVVFSQSSKAAPITEEMYNSIYKILNEYSHHSGIVMSDRSNTILNKIRRIDPSLNITFIPRTLYDLMFIRSCIEEEVNLKGPCDSLTAETIFKFDAAYEACSKGNPSSSDKEYVHNKLSKCWHICDFNEYLLADINSEFVRKLAYRMNSLIVEQLTPQGFFTGEKISKFLDQELKFFRDHHDNFLHTLLGFSVERFGSGTSAFINFGSELKNFKFSYSRNAPLGISCEAEAQSVRIATAMECHELACNAFILFRGGELEKEKKLDHTNKKSFSYGTSLFAGAIHDPTACAFHYLKSRETFAIRVPFDEDCSSSLYIPRKENAVCQMTSTGEHWHARSLVGRDFPEKPEGFPKSTGNIPKHLKSQYDSKVLSQQINRYNATAVVISPGKGSDVTS